VTVAEKQIPERLALTEQREWKNRTEIRRQENEIGTEAGGSHAEPRHAKSGSALAGTGRVSTRTGKNEFGQKPELPRR
jgi:hypothetical protein